MATEMKMPQLSDTMDKGKILSWRKKEGDTVSRGEVLAEVETDKANLEIECFTPGTLLKIMIPAGSVAKVGEAIAVIGQAGESVGAAKPATSTTPITPSASSQVALQNGSQVTPAPRVAAGSGGSSNTITELLSSPSRSVASVHVFPASATDRVKASPLARKIAEHNRVDLRTVAGSGPLGRILKRDVEARMQAPSSAPSSASGPQATFSSSRPSAAVSNSPSGSGQSFPLSKMRETIARRMQESVTQAPHFYTTAVIEMDQASLLREALKAKPEFQGISINHLIIKAAGYALAREPRVNRALKDGLVFAPDQINIGIITAVEDGLLIPVIRNADQLPLAVLVTEARSAIERARSGKPNSSDLMGGTFSISNMGMYDVENFTAIINPGQGAVLAVSATRDEPVVRNGQIVIGKRMKVTLSVDHRIIDGIMAAEWLKHFKEALEIPGLLLLA